MKEPIQVNDYAEHITKALKRGVLLKRIDPKNRAGNLGLALHTSGVYPVRTTAYKSLLDRAAEKARRAISRQRIRDGLHGPRGHKQKEELLGSSYPIHIGGCIAVDHRHQPKVADFDLALDQLFAQFTTRVESLQKLLDIKLDYPVNAMTRVCKKLSMPKKAAVEAISIASISFRRVSAASFRSFCSSS